ncbi:MAG TPA: hypothetical protein VKA34_23560 [Balneolales bacterium]|nr:hypothetical protein [Balneolales bacterium]
MTREKSINLKNDVILNWIQDPAKAWHRLQTVDDIAKNKKFQK